MARIRKTFRVGDVVMVVENEYKIHGHKAGELGMVINVDKNPTTWPIQVQVGTLRQWLSPKDIRHFNINALETICLSTSWRVTKKDEVR